MNTFSWRPGRLAVVAVAIVAVAVLPIANRAQAAHPAAVTGKVGFMFSDFTTSPRWQFDKSYFIAQLKKLDPKVTVIVKDAHASQTTQQQEATSVLTTGVKALIDVPVDTAQAAAIVRAAHNEKPSVPVLAYDRLISGTKVDAYASFDGYAVGQQQGRFLKSHVKKGGTIVEIAGSPTDNNAHLFHNGAWSVLKPLFKNHHFKLGYHKFTPNWDPAKAQQEMASALNSLNNKVAGVLVANDTMASGVIAALKAQHLAGKVFVTGQDAAVIGLQNILLGYQSMTVYKPIRLLAPAAARIVDTWLHGKKFTSSTTTPNGAGNVPSVIEPVTTVTKKNIKSTVLKDGYVTKAALCNGIPASDCKGL